MMHASLTTKIAISILMSSVATYAATFTWDSSGTSPATPADGSGTWDTSSLNWSNGSADVAWTGTSDVAVFGNNNGAAGTVALAGTTNVGGLTFNSAGSGNYLLTGGSIATSTAANTTITMNTDATIASAITGGGSYNLYINGTGVLTLTGANTFASNLVINSGAAVSVSSITSSGSANPLGSPLGGVRINGGTLIYTGSTTAANRVIRLYQAGGTFDMEGTGVMTIGSSFGSNYAKLDSAGGATRTLTLTGNSTGYGNFTGALTNSSVSGDATSLLKTGTGKWILAGTNTYTGATTVTNGTLLLHTTTTLQNATGDVNIQGGTLTSDIASAVNLGGNLNLSAAGILDANGASSVGSFALAANKNFSMTGGTLLLTLTGASTYDTIVADSTSGGTFSITGGTIDLQNSVALDYTGSYQIFKNFTGGSVSGLSFINYDSTHWTANLDTSGVLSFAAVAPVPEAASLGFLTIGAGLLIARRRKI